MTPFVGPAKSSTTATLLILSIAHPVLQIRQETQGQVALCIVVVATFGKQTFLAHEEVWFGFPGIVVARLLSSSNRPNQRGVCVVLTCRCPCPRHVTRPLRSLCDVPAIHSDRGTPVSLACGFVSPVRPRNSGDRRSAPSRETWQTRSIPVRARSGVLCPKREMLCSATEGVVARSLRRAQCAAPSGRRAIRGAWRPARNLCFMVRGEHRTAVGSAQVQTTLKL